MANLAADNERANQQLEVDRKYKEAQANNFIADNLRAEDQFQLNKEAAGRKTADAAKLDYFNRLVSQHFKQPANVQPPYAMEPVPFTTSDFVRYMGQAGIAGTPGSGPMLSSFARTAATDLTQPQVLSKEGHKLAYAPKGTLFELKDPVQPTTGDLKAIAVKDDQGVVRGYVMQNKGGGITQLGRDKVEHRGLTASQEVLISKRLSELRTMLNSELRRGKDKTGEELTTAQAKQKLIQDEIAHLESLRAPAVRPNAPAGAGAGAMLPIPDLAAPSRAAMLNQPVAAPGADEEEADAGAEDMGAVAAPDQADQAVPEGETTEAAPEPPTPPEPSASEADVGAAGAAARVRVVAPDGTIGWIPAEQLSRALKKGYTRAR
jgi:hypothetical protein